MSLVDNVHALLAAAEAHLAKRDCDSALQAFTHAEAAGADADRCAGGRWMAHMLTGQYAEAWQQSDAIRGRGAPDANRFWHGEPIDGQRLMLRCLHGYGDTVMYLRWLPELRRRCREVIVQAAPEMLPIVAAIVAGSDAAASDSPGHRPVPHLREAKVGSAAERAPVRVITWGAPGESDRDQWDVQIESAELPYLFRATTATLPAPVSFAFPETQMHHIRTRLADRSKPRVGLVWTGSNYDAARSVPFEQFRRLLDNHDVEFWSLQAPANNEGWARFCAERGWNARTFYTGAADHTGIADMAALASQMDAIVTIDTMAAHVAGSLGLPTWLLLKREADWRWMLDREGSPWYPTVKLLRQRAAGDWSAPLTRASDALRDLQQ